MDVRISYGHALDDIPDKITELLEKFQIADVLEMIRISSQLIRMSNMEMADELIDQARIKLGSLDRLLNDSQAILKGYINTTNKPSEPQMTPQETPDVD
jgi:Mg2+ and Co2+ transporter CorA